MVAVHHSNSSNVTPHELLACSWILGRSEKGSLNVFECTALVGPRHRLLGFSPPGFHGWHLAIIRPQLYLNVRVHGK